MDDPSNFALISEIILLQSSSIGIILGVSILAILLFCSAFISGAEVAYFSLGPKDLDELNSSTSNQNDTILQLLNSPKRLLATILITNNFVNIGIVVLSSYLSSSLFSFTDAWMGIAPEIWEFVVLVGLVTFLILLVGEVIPKVYANKYPLKLAAIMAFPILYLSKFFWAIGLSRFLIFSTSIIHKKVTKKTENISVDQLSHALELTDNSEVSKDEQKILEGIVKFGNTDVKQIMQPRTDVTTINLESKYDEIIKQILDSGFSRIPVHKENFDHIEGILYVKDLLAHLDKTTDFNWKTLIREAYFIPESKKIDDLLGEFQAKKIHLAIVVDEYGGNSGIITLEDIIEEIVGDITDEFDDEDIVYSKLDDNNYVFEGKTPLKDLYRVLEINGDNFEEHKGDSDTLAGFLLELSGKIMQKNEKVSFENYSFTIEASDKRRIKRVKVTINEPAVEDSEK